MREPLRNAGRWTLPDRRTGLRIMTLKNAAWVLGALLIIFVAFSAYNELRDRDPISRGRLSRRRVKEPPPPQTQTRVEPNHRIDLVIA